MPSQSDLLRLTTLEPMDPDPGSSYKCPCKEPPARGLLCSPLFIDVVGVYCGASTDGEMASRFRSVFIFGVIGNRDITVCGNHLSRVIYNLCKPTDEWPTHLMGFVGPLPISAMFCAILDRDVHCLRNGALFVT